ncbi:MAG: ABC transporter permease, partial [Gemmatimonadales bacterium]
MPQPTVSTAPLTYPEETKGSFFGDIAESVGEIRLYRGLLRELTLREIRIRYKQAVLGFGWAILMPFLIVAAGTVLRVAVAQLSGVPLDRAALIGVAIKSLPWAFFVGSLNFATPSLTANFNLVSRIYFPREVLPLAAVLAQVFDTAIGAFAVGLVVLALGLEPATTWLWVPVLLALLIAFTLAAALFL